MQNKELLKFNNKKKSTKFKNKINEMAINILNEHKDL